MGTGSAIRIGVALLAGLLVGSCGSTGRVIGDNLPAWAGGLPEGAPPRPGEPGYEEYRKSLREPKPGSPAAAAASPKSNEQVDAPSH